MIKKYLYFLLFFIFLISLKFLVFHSMDYFTCISYLLNCPSQKSRERSYKSNVVIDAKTKYNAIELILIVKLGAQC